MDIVEELKKHRHDTDSKKVTIGFDGYVDEVLHIVEDRKDTDSYEQFKSIRQFGNHILESTSSCGLEMVSITKKIGGNGPILANALGSLGVYTNCIGTFGEPEIHRSFLESQISNLVNIGDIAYTLAFEFQDGKLMLGELGSLSKLTWDYMKEKVGTDKLIGHLNESEIIGITNWSQIQNSNNLWEGILKCCMPNLNQDRKRYLFFDLADPSKRDKEELKSALKLIEAYGNFGENVLGLNFTEADIIYKMLYGESPIEKNIIVKGKKILDNLNINMLVVHSSECAVAFHDGEAFMEESIKISRPKLLTGCGDNFNAGFCLGLLLKLPLNLCLRLGIEVASYYITNGKSADLDALIDFITERGGPK